MPSDRPTKRFVDIEHALRWAYRDELPKRLRGGPTFADLSRPQRSNFFDDDGVTREPGYPASLGEPHADALAIETAVRGLAAWRGHTFGADDPAGLTYGFAGLAVDHQAAVMEAIAAMAGTIACHARAGTRPGRWRGKPARWVQELPRPYADTGGNGKPRVLVDETFYEVWNERAKRVRHLPLAELPGRRVPPGAPTHVVTIAAPPLRKGVYRMGSYCPLEWQPDPSKLVIVRAEWAAWRMGLELLWRDLEGRLESVAVLPPAAPWWPWAGEREAHGRPPELFRGLRDEPYRCETREQTAMRRRAAQRRTLETRTEEARPTHQRRAAKRNSGGPDTA